MAHVPLVLVNVKETEVAVLWNPSLLSTVKLKVPNPSTFWLAMLVCLNEGTNTPPRLFYSVTGPTVKVVALTLRATVEPSPIR